MAPTRGSFSAAGGFAVAIKVREQIIIATRWAVVDLRRVCIIVVVFLSKPS